MAGGLFVLPKMHKITQNSLLKKHGIFCLTFSIDPSCIFLFIFFRIYDKMKQNKPSEEKR